MKTRIVMDSGREYILDAPKSEVLKLFTNSLGVIINGFVHFEEGFSIAPLHVSSVEEVRE
ncbi:hypothetical protein [Tumebacillus flagellatus]|nr:hypothetical protein [Tumebacillus flagellatus]